MMGIVSIIIWAIVIVVLFNYFASTAAMSGQVEIKFSELIQLVKEDQVEEIQLQTNKYTVTLKEDAQKSWMQEYYGDDYNDNLKMPKLYAAPLSYTDFLLLLDEHGVSYYTPVSYTHLYNILYKRVNYTAAETGCQRVLCKKSASANCGRAWR